MPLSRRQFLIAGAATAVMSACGPGRAERGARAVVIGAGLAGLTAAHELHAAGWQVTVLEAENRIGGRVHTVRHPSFQGQHAEGGGEFIDTTHHRIIGYARRFGLELEDVRTSGEDLEDVLFWRGERVAIDEDDFDDAVSPFAARVEAVAREFSLEELDARSVASVIDESHLDDRARFLVEHDIRSEYAVDPEQLSLRFYLELAELAPGDEGKEAYRVRGGNDQLVRALAEPLATEVHRSQAVRQVRWSADGVNVDGEPADVAIIAVPLPALREIDFTPDLPPAVAAATAAGYGSVTKTLLRYGRRFWQTEGFTGSMLTDLAVGGTWEATDLQGGDGGVLIGYSPVQAASDAAGDIGRVFPESAVAPDASIEQPWPHCWVAFRPGEGNRFRTALREPVGRLIFAGEHTDPLAAYMEGAIRSGLRAAKQARRLV